MCKFFGWLHLSIYSFLQLLIYSVFIFYIYKNYTEMEDKQTISYVVKLFFYFLWENQSPKHNIMNLKDMILLYITF